MRMHDLSPNDESVLEQLQGLYAELKDYRSLVQLYENQILRGRDPNARAETARNVALLWRDKLNDPRETADAWRRVLRCLANERRLASGSKIPSGLLELLYEWYGAGYLLPGAEDEY